MHIYTTQQRLAGLPAQHAREARIANSYAAIATIHARADRYFPAVTGCGILGRFTTTDRPLRCTHPNAGRDVTYVD